MARARNCYGKKGTNHNSDYDFLGETKSEYSHKRQLDEQDTGFDSPFKKPRLTSPSSSTENPGTDWNAGKHSTERVTSSVDAIPLDKNRRRRRPSRTLPQNTPLPSPPATISSMDEILESLRDRSKSPPTILYRRENKKGLEALTDDVISILLDFLLRLNRSIQPVFQAGMLAHGLQSTPLNDEGVVQFNNIDLSVLQVNKIFNQFGSEIFYGCHHFVFTQPERCKWWIKRIGSNFPKVRHLALCMSSGWTLTRNLENPQDELECVFEDMSFEEQWYNVLSGYVQPKHNLRSLRIRFQGWQDIQHYNRYRNSRRTPEVPFRHVARISLWRWRTAIFDFLKLYMRGIPEVILSQTDDTWISKDYLLHLSLLMQQAKDTITERQTRRLTLSEILVDVRKSHVYSK